MQKRTVWLAASITVAASVFLMVFTIDPIWTRLGLHVPGAPGALVNFTQPVDAVFYARNAQDGYQWGSRNRTSIWFHPLLVWGVDLLPGRIPANDRLWLISILSGVVALGLAGPLFDHLSKEKLDPPIIGLAAVLPGGLAIATGNAEFPCLVFTTALLLSVLNKDHPVLPLLWGGLAVLAKPNALYMVPILAVYLIHAWPRGDRRVALNSLAGIGALLLTFLGWMLFVDYQSHEPGAYWAARKITIVPLEFSFLERSLRIFLFSPDAAQKLKFASALFIPLVEAALAVAIPLRRQVDRAAILAGIGAIFLSTVLLNNPNKIMSYMITLPAHLIVSLVFIREAFRYKNPEGKLERITRKSAGVMYLCYCAVMLVFFILGTPLRWYY